MPTEKQTSPDVPLENAMITWNPKTGPGGNQVGDGRIVIINHPDKDRECDDLKLSNTHGACWGVWGEMGKKQRMSKLLEEGWKTVIRDQLDPKDVHAAFMVIPEYREIFGDPAIWQNW